MDGDRPSLLERNPWVKRRKLSVADYYRMGEAGIFADAEGVELIEGELVATSRLTSQHGGASIALNQLLMFGDTRFLVTVRGPLRLSEFSETRPDALLVKSRADFYRRAHPTPPDVLLLIEIADLSLRYDREAKLPLYALHRIPEVWIVNLEGNIVEVHRDPQGEAYRAVSYAARGEVLEPALLPGLRIPVTEVLG